MKTQKQTKEYWEKYWKAYWETVKSCKSLASGYTEIHHINGQIEYFNSAGKKIVK